MKLLTGLGFSSAVVMSVLAAGVLWLTAQALFFGLHDTGIVVGADATFAGAVSGAVGGLCAGIVSAAGLLIAGTKSKIAIPAALVTAGAWTLVGAVVGAFRIDQLHVAAGALGGAGSAVAGALAFQPKAPTLPTP
jgi:hypothetical protein